MGVMNVIRNLTGKIEPRITPQPGRGWLVIGDSIIFLVTRNNRVIPARRLLSDNGDTVIYEDIYGNIKTIRKEQLKKEI